MKVDRYILFCVAIASFAILQSACVKEYIDVPKRPVPKVGMETDSLRASYISSSIVTTSDPYWNEADYIVVELENLSTQNLYNNEGLLNMTGTFNGLSDFNNGGEVNLRMKAAYDDNNLYILAEWEDSQIHASRRTWLWDGPEDPLKPNDSTGQWTSQRNDDNIALAFDINGASTTAGIFSEIGCAASCHLNGNNYQMSPEAGKVDIWNWSVAHSAPFGHAFDMVTTLDSNLVYDGGTKFFRRNSNDPSDNRSGPAYEWNGVSQDITKADGTPSKLDPAYFLVNKTEFIGNPLLGEALYLDHDKGCLGCHGEAGMGYGEIGDGPPFDNASFSRKYSRTTLDGFAIDESHEGHTYYEKLSETERDDLIAYIKGLAGVPGYTLTQPVEGESATDITTNSNVNLVRVQATEEHGSYKVLFIRKLITGHSDDVVFDPDSGSPVAFGIALMDNDGKNHIGSLLEHLIFKSK